MPITDPAMSQPAALWLSPRNGLRQRFLVAIRVGLLRLPDTHLPTPEGWKAELA